MPNDTAPLVLGIGGTPNPGSSTERALMVSLAAAAAEGARTLAITGPALQLPMYTPGVAQRTPEAVALVDAYRSCAGIIIASPAYHGTISGFVKNALDYTEDLRGDARVYFDGIAVGTIVCAGGWQAAAQTLSTLRSVAHALRGWPTPLGVTLNTSARQFDESGQCLELSTKHQLETVGRQVVKFARLHAPDESDREGASQ